MKKCLLIPFGVVLALSLSGCGEKLGDYIVRMKPEYSAMREKLASAASMIPAQVTEGAATDGDLDPPLDFREEAKEPTNTEFLMFRHLTDPYFDYNKEGGIDLFLAKHLKRHLEWTGENSPLADSGKKRRISDSDIAEFEGVLATRYLAVARLEKYEPVVATGPQSYQGGSAVMSGHLFDLKEMKLLGSFLIEAVPAKEVNFTYNKNQDDPQERMVAFARSSVYSSLRKQFAEKMQTMFGGTFSLR